MTDNSFNTDQTPGLPDILTGFQPAFKHRVTGESHLSQLANGIPSQDYSFSGLPDCWVTERDSLGNAVALVPEVEAGYWRDARFIALKQLSDFPLDG